MGQRQTACRLALWVTPAWPALPAWSGTRGLLELQLTSGTAAPVSRYPAREGRPLLWPASEHRVWPPQDAGAQTRFGQVGARDWDTTEVAQTTESLMESQPRPCKSLT